MRITSAKQLRTALKRDVLLKALVDYIEITPGAQIKAVAGTALFVADAPKIDGLVATWVIRAAGFTPDDLDTVLKAVQAKVGGEIQNNRLAVSQLATQELIDQAEASIRQRKEREEITAAVRKASAVKDGRDGIDGLRGERGPQGPQGLQGPPGRDGIDGIDLLATDASLFDLKDVEQGIQLSTGQVLTWNGTEWTNLFVPQVLSAGVNSTSSSDLPSTTIEFKYHNETGEPHDREFHTNNADPTLVTILHVAHTNNSGTDISSLLAGLVPNTDRIYVYKVNEPSSAHLYSVSSYVETANGFEITVAHLETPGGEPAFVNNSIYGFTFITAGTGGGGGGISDAPSNNNYYVRYNGTWVDLSDALDAIAGLADIRDGGDFSQGTSTTSGTQTYDGGDLTLTTSAATDASVLDGGLYTGLTNTTLDGGIATV